MLGHEHVACYYKTIAPPGGFEFVFEDSICRRTVQERLAPITTERDEVEHSTLLVAN